MGEYFDICFYDIDVKNAHENLEKLRVLYWLPTLHNPPCARKFKLMSDREMCVYNVEYNDFVEQLICFDELPFSKETFEEMGKMLAEIVDVGFSEVPTAKFATAIYQLTGYYTPEDAKLSDMYEILHRFPFVFYRKQDVPPNVRVECEVGNTVCVYNTNAQRLWSP